MCKSKGSPGHRSSHWAKKKRNLLLDKTTPPTQHPKLINAPARAAWGQKEKWEWRDITELPRQDIFVKGRKEWSRKGGKERAEIEE